MSVTSFLLSSYHHDDSIFRKISHDQLVGEFAFYNVPGEGFSSFDGRMDVIGQSELSTNVGFTTSFRNRDYYLLSLENSELHGDKMYVITPHGVLTDSVSAFDYVALAENTVNPELIEHDGSALVVGNIGYKNYYHWVFQAVSVILEAKSKLKELPTLLVPPLNKWRSEYLEILGVQSGSYYEMKPSLVVRPKALLYSCFSSSDFPFAPDARIISNFAEFSRDMNAVNNSLKHERIYISRGDTQRRSIANETEVIELLEGYGFKSHCLEGYSVADQISLFRNADTIVAPHGAGLTNLLYCLQCVSVTEIFSENYVNSCFFRICQSKGIDHYRMSSTLLNENGRHFSESLVNLELLKQHVEKIV